MNLEIKKLYKDSQMPKKAHETDACFDLYAHSFSEDNSHYLNYGTGIAINIPIGYVGLLFPRSSVTNTSLILGNCVGVIDAGFQGEVSFRFKEIPHYQLKVYNVGERIGQILILPLTEVNIQEVDEFTFETKRGKGGYGSTGLN